MSAAINTGGPAFPVEFDHHTFQPRTVEEAKRLMSGMTLRDYFAAKAMQPLIAGRSWSHFNGTEDELIATWARASYRLADAMLTERDGSAA